MRRIIGTRVLITPIACILCAIALHPALAQGAQIEGVEFADQIELPTEPATELSLFSAGLLRYRIVFRGYVAALYLPANTKASAAFEDRPKRLELSYFWSIGAEDFAGAADQLLARELQPSQLNAIRDRVDRLHAAYRDVRPGDRYSLTYLPGTGTQLRLNSELLTTVPGFDFAQAYFGIWLGENPLDAGLRDVLLKR